MIFYYKGKNRSSTGYDAASGCLLIIALSAIIFLLSLLDFTDPDEFKEYGFQIILALIMGASLLYSLFRKKGKLDTHKITLKDGYLKMNAVAVKVAQLHLDCYYNKDLFNRYHLWDNEGKIAVYSVYMDDLYRHLFENLPHVAAEFQIAKYIDSAPQATLITPERKLSYDLESGGYTIYENQELVADFIPEVFAIDGKYQKGIGLLKKK